MPLVGGTIPPSYVAGVHSTCRSEMAAHIHIVATDSYGIHMVICAGAHAATQGIPPVGDTIPPNYAVDAYSACQAEVAPYITIDTADGYGIDGTVDARYESVVPILIACC